MPADIVLEDTTVNVTGGALVCTTETPNHAVFQGPGGAKIHLEAGRIWIQAPNRGGSVALSPENLSFVKKIRAGSVACEEVDTGSVTVGGPSAAEQPGSPGQLTVDNGRGQVTVRIDGRTGDIRLDGDVSSLSDARCKEDIATLTHALEKVSGLRGVTFRWKQEAGCPDRRPDRQVGFLAQEVREVVPEVVQEDEDGHFRVGYAGLVPVLVEAIKEQQRMIDVRERRMEEIERRLASIEAATSSAV